MIFIFCFTKTLRLFDTGFYDIVLVARLSYLLFSKLHSVSKTAAGVPLVAVFIGGYMFTYTDKRKFYDSGNWRMLRGRILRRDGYICQMSKRYGKIKPARVVHHIFPFEHYPQYATKEWNLIALSVEWHEKMHERDGHVLSITGWRLLEKIARERGITLTAEDKCKCLGLRDK